MTPELLPSDNDTDFIAERCQGCAQHSPNCACTEYGVFHGVVILQFRTQVSHPSGLLAGVLATVISHLGTAEICFSLTLTFELHNPAQFPSKQSAGKPCDHRQR